MKTDNDMRLYEVTLEKPVTIEDFKNGKFGRVMVKCVIVQCERKEVKKIVKEKGWTITDIRDYEKEQWLYTQRNIKWMLDH